MAPKTANTQPERSAWLVVAAFVASLAYGILLLTAFDPGVQDLDADELFASDDAEPFLVADLFFPLLYGLAFPLAAWRFGVELTSQRPPWFVIAAVVALAIGAVFDLAENTLLLAAIGGESAELVDTAHAIAIPKLVAGGIGNLMAIIVLIRALISLGRRRASDE